MHLLLFLSLLNLINQTSALFTQSKIAHKTPPSYDYQTGISPDGTILAKADTNMSIIIEQKIGLSYQYLQQIVVTSSVHNFFFTSQNQRMILTLQSSIQIFKYENSQYTLFQQIFTPDMAITLMTNDFLNIVMCPLPASLSSPAIQNYILSGNTYIYLQSLIQAANNILDIRITKGGEYLVTGGVEQIIRIYSRDSSLVFKKINEFSCSTEILQLIVSDDISKIVVGGGVASNIYLYEVNGLGSYQLTQSPGVFQAPVYKIMASSNWELIVYMAINFCYLNMFSNASSSLVSVFNFQHPNLTGYEDCTMNSFGMELICSTLNQTTYLTQCLIINCTVCSTPTICISCEPYSYIQNSNCVYNTSFDMPPNSQTPSNTSTQQITNICVDGIVNRQNICIEYCSSNCMRCNGSSLFCTSCSDMYVLDGDNFCALESEDLNIFGIFYSIVSFLRIRKLKSLFFILDDIWLYQYHKVDYDKTPKQIFTTIHIIESMKDQILDFQKWEIELSIKDILLDYMDFTNQKYLIIERSDDWVFNNQVDYLLKSVPVGIVIFLVFKALFYLLFNFRISKYFRIMSLNWFLLVMLLEGQIEKLTFLAFRNFQNLFFSTIAYKLSAALFVSFMFILILYSFAAYPLFFVQYKKLVKYFLDNLLTQHFCAFLMALLYGVRPFLKGITHSIFYFDTEKQLWVLSLIDIAIFAIFVGSEFSKRVSLNKMVFTMMGIYLMTNLPLNILLSWNYRYRSDKQLSKLVDQMFLIIIFLRIGVLSLKFFISFYEPAMITSTNESEAKADNCPKATEAAKNQIEIKEQAQPKKKKYYHLILIEKKNSIQSSEFSIPGYELQYRRP